MILLKISIAGISAWVLIAAIGYLGHLLLLHLGMPPHYIYNLAHSNPWGFATIAFFFVATVGAGFAGIFMDGKR